VDISIPLALGGGGGGGGGSCSLAKLVLLALFATFHAAVHAIMGEAKRRMLHALHQPFYKSTIPTSSPQSPSPNRGRTRDIFGFKARNYDARNFRPGTQPLFNEGKVRGVVARDE
jgi:hypothetical protein